MTELQKAILEIVKENSGGVKFTQLITSVVATQKFRNHTVESVLEAAESIEGIGVLRYAMELGPGMDREKIFIYRKGT